MMLDEKQIQAVLSSKWVVKQGRQPEASTTCLAQEQLANIQSSDGSSWDQSLEDEEPSGQPWEGDNNKLREIIKVDPRTTTWEVAKELSVDHSTVTQHLKQIGKVKNLISRCLMSWPEIKKIMILKCQFSYFIQQWTIFWSDYDIWWKVILYDNQQAMTSSVVGLRRNFKPLSNAKPAPKKKVTVTVWWSAVGLMYSFLNPGNTNTSEKSAQRVNEMHWKLQRQQPALVNRKGLIFLHNNAWPHITQPAFQKMNKLGYKVLPHLQLELDVEQQTGSK